jgi:hypothetical protein
VWGLCGGCTAPTGFAVVTVRDPQGLAELATTLRVGSTPSDQKAEQVDLRGHGFPVSFTLSDPGSVMSSIWIEAADRSNSVLGRARADVSIDTAHLSAVSTDLARPCSADPDCNDYVFCNGIEHCQDSVCAAGSPACPTAPDACVSIVCDEAKNACVRSIYHALCGDGFCDPSAGCVPQHGCTSDSDCWDSACIAVSCSAGACVRGMGCGPPGPSACSVDLGRLSWKDVTPASPPWTAPFDGLGFDPDRAQFLASDTSSLLWERDEISAWKKIGSTNQNLGGQFLFDLRVRSLIALGSSGLYRFDRGSSAWIQAGPASPIAASVAYDTRREVVITFDALTRRTWQIATSSSAWTLTSSSAPIDPTSGPATIAYDEARDRVVAIAEVRGFLHTLEWDGTAWSDMTQSVSPPARAGFGLAYHRAIARVVLFGGSATSDTWAWDGLRWTQLTLPTAPTPSVSAYDCSMGQIVAIEQGPGHPNQIWQLGP